MHTPVQTDPALEAFLGAPALQVLRDLGPDAPIDAISSAILVCAHALQHVDRLDFSRYELAELGTPDLSIWSELAPSMRSLMLELREATDNLCALFPATADLDNFETEHSYPSGPDDIFALIDTGTAESSSPSVESVDDIVARAGENPEEELGRTIQTLAHMLQGEFQGFGQALRRPDVVADRWGLLGALQDFRSTCEQCLEAIIAAILNTFCHGGLEEILPRYQDATRRQLNIRSTVVDLVHELGQFNTALQQAPEGDANILAEAMRTCLNEVAETEAYRHILASEKRLIIMLRLQTDAFLAGRLSLSAFRPALDDATRCLELLRSGHSEALTSHDQHYVRAARRVLKYGIHQARDYLEALYGRSAALDESIRLLRLGSPVAPETLDAQLGAIEAELS